MLPSPLYVSELMVAGYKLRLCFLTRRHKGTGTFKEDEMTEILNETPDKIKKTANAIKKLRPAYSKILDFYEKIFTAQEKSAAKSEIEPAQLADDIISIKAKEKFPLFSL